MNELQPCKVCRCNAKKVIVPPDESMHIGWVVVECSGVCGNSLTLRPGDMKLSGIVGESGWDFIDRGLKAAEREAIRRWNLLNS